MRNGPLAVATILCFMLGGLCRADEAPAQISTAKPSASEGVSATYSGITDAELAELKLQPQLKRLYLRDSKVTDAGVVHLKELKELQFLSLERTTSHQSHRLSGDRSQDRHRRNRTMLVD